MSELVFRQGIAISIPDGYTRKKKGTVHKNDLAWVSSKQIWTKPTEFMIGTNVIVWYTIAKKKIPSSLSKLIKASMIKR